MPKTTASSRIWKTVGSLVLAMINATLILVVLCLILGLTLVNRIDGLTQTFAQNLVQVEPLRDELQETRAEIAGLRSYLSDVLSESGDLSASASARLQSQLTRLNTKMETADARMTALADMPAQLIDQAVQSLADEAALTVARFSGCTPADRDAVAAAPTPPPAD